MSSVNNLLVFKRVIKGFPNLLSSFLVFWNFCFKFTCFKVFSKFLFNKKIISISSFLVFSKISVYNLLVLGFFKVFFITRLYLFSSFQVFSEISLWLTLAVVRLLQNQVKKPSDKDKTLQQRILKTNLGFRIKCTCKPNFFLPVLVFDK